VTKLSPPELTERIVAKSRSLGASLVGIADVEPLQASPSHRILPRIGMGVESRWRDAPHDLVPAEVCWPSHAVSAVVIGVSHPTDQRELDWYDGKGTPGNRVLIRIVKELSDWLEHDLSCTSHRPPYFIESDGVFMKDAAVLAGLGSIGRNNLVITPEFGPRIRWRVLLLDQQAQATGPLAYDPCEGCDARCRTACPVGAFDEIAYDASVLAQPQLPGTDGAYDRVTCNTKMAQDVVDAAAALTTNEDEQKDLTSTMNAFEEAVMAIPAAGGEERYGVKYCRRCELSCPVGKQGSSRKGFAGVTEVPKPRPEV
jgi:epoxyqueuosine reductase